MSNQISISIVPGNVAPRYADAEGLVVDHAAITEQGTESGLPIVDLVCRDGAGATFVVSFTGRIVLALAGAIRGVNTRIHGTPEP